MGRPQGVHEEVWRGCYKFRGSCTVIENVLSSVRLFDWPRNCLGITKTRSRSHPERPLGSETRAARRPPKGPFETQPPEHLGAERGHRPSTGHKRRCLGDLAPAKILRSGVLRPEPGVWSAAKDFSPEETRARTREDAPSLRPAQPARGRAQGAAPASGKPAARLPPSAQSLPSLVAHLLISLWLRLVSGWPTAASSGTTRHTSPCHSRTRRSPMRHATRRDAEDAARCPPPPIAVGAPGRSRQRAGRPGAGSRIREGSGHCAPRLAEARLRSKACANAEWSSAPSFHPIELVLMSLASI